MDKLKEDLPEITKKVLHEEDMMTRHLVRTLLQEVMVNQNKGDFYSKVRKILDDEIEKSISAGLISLEDFEGGL